jgi:hypothetical protein
MPYYATCRDCSQPDRRIVGRGLCAACYDRHWKAQTLAQFPRLSRPPKPVPAEKPCAICKVTLPLSAFARNSQRPDGHGSYCKACAKAKYHEPTRARKRELTRPEVGDLECDTCKQVLPVSEYYWKADQGRFKPTCKTCCAVYNKGRHKPEVARDRVLRRKYDMTALEFDLLLATQAGGCAICEIEVNPDGPALAVDHCHTTGRVRGILCGLCNKAIGLFRDDPLLLEKAVVYLRK